jgi:hypothetical protein
MIMVKFELLGLSSGNWRAREPWLRLRLLVRITPACGRPPGRERGGLI